MGWFGSKDWNVVAVIFERSDLYRVKRQPGQGRGRHDHSRRGQKHPRTISGRCSTRRERTWKGGRRRLQVDPARRTAAPRPRSRRQSFRREVLATLESGKEDKWSKPLVWNGYPAKGEVRK